MALDDGGRLAALSGPGGDCVCRAFAIATGLSYDQVHADIERHAQRERPAFAKRRRYLRSCAATGVYRATIDRLAREYSMEWTSTFRFGESARRRVRSGDLPDGSVVLRVSRHVIASIDGVLHDTHDSTRGGTRILYGYWRTS